MRFNFQLQDLLRKKDAQSVDTDHIELNQVLRLKDLVFFGIAAIVGAGIFSTVGKAVEQGGPAVSLLFVLTSLVCLVSAYCYARFASIVRAAGSAYSYAYVAFGELIAWLMAWALFLEYVVSNIAVAISWSGYFQHSLKHLHIHLPLFLQNDIESLEQQVSTTTLASFPHFFGYTVAINLPACLVSIGITVLCYVGIKESVSMNNFFVYVKLFIILLILVVGATLIDTSNYVPFAPHGASGILQGVSSVFFAYIGFDAISTTAEECKNPQKDLPKAMVLSLAISTIIYMGIVLVITGIAPYHTLGTSDPLALVFDKAAMPWLSAVISVSAVFTMTAVLLVYQLGQPRIWMSMARDGLLPGIFAKIHPKFKTPSFSTILMGMLVAIPALFMNLSDVTDLSSIGTLFAFAVVCAGMMIEENNFKEKRGFQLPQWNVYFGILATCIIGLIGIVYFEPSLEHWNRLPTYIWLLVVLTTGVLACIKKYNFFPLLGIWCNVYLMSEIPIHQWKNFFIWMMIGLLVYLSYGFHKSKLKKRTFF